MKNLLLICLLSILVFPVFAGDPPIQNVSEEDPKAIVIKMVEKIDKLKTLTFTLVRRERFGDEYINGELVAKLQCNPRKIYLKNTFPNDDSEVLWVTGENKGKARVNPNSFPYINLNMDPHGSLILKDQHHSIHEIGFDYFNLIIKDALHKHEADFDRFVSYKGIKIWKGIACHVVEIEYPDFKYVPYVVLEGEDLFDIGRKMVVSEILIIEKNSKVKGFDDVKEGETIMIPNVYAKKSVVYIDKVSFLPIQQEVYDEKGMFERYQYVGLIVNPTIKLEEFDEDYDDYGY